MQNNKVRL